MAPKAPKKPKGKSNIKKTSAAMDAFMTIGPYAQDIANYLAHGTAAGGLGALGYLGNKARKMRKKHDEELKANGYNLGGEVSGSSSRGMGAAIRGGKFTGVK